MADFDTSLPIRTENDGDAVAKIVGADGTTVVKAATDGAGNDALHVIDADSEALLSTIDADTGSILSTLTDDSQSTQIVDGAGDILGVNVDGSINVVIQDEGISSTEIHVFGTTVAGIPGTENTVVDRTVTAAKTFLLKKVQASASGKFKVEVKTGTPASETTKMVAFGSTASGFVDIAFPAPIEVIAADKILVLITNLDTANADVYAFINGNEV